MYRAHNIPGDFLVRPLRCYYCTYLQRIAGVRSGSPPRAVDVVAQNAAEKNIFFLREYNNIIILYYYYCCEYSVCVRVQKKKRVCLIGSLFISTPHTAIAPAPQKTGNN